MNFFLIGKPNVGKSSIFNILTGSDINIVHKLSGTTRDWHKELIKGTKSYILDTPGVLITDKNKKIILNTYFTKILKQKRNLFLYVVDYTQGFNEIDKFSINQLRKFNKKIILIVNKFDNNNFSFNEEFKNYGINEIIYISCTHRTGINNLKKIILNNNAFEEKIINYDYSIAIFGKPNSGKSTFLNTLLGYERVKTNSKAGTTSDYVNETFSYKKNSYRIVDTAGIGKKSNIKDKSISYFSTKKSLTSINKVDVAFIMLESINLIDRQDKRIIKLIYQKAKTLILIINKIDLIEHKKIFKDNIIEKTKYDISESKNIKIFFISAFNKRHINKILDYVQKSLINNNNFISTNKINSWLKHAVDIKQHPLVDNKKINFKYAVQIKSTPITIKVFCNYYKKVEKNYIKFLINNFNQKFKILNQKTKFIFSSSKNPYV
tara:strand:- start:559 stop:1863 length:1305 start_codon:yes stop_codon:yes gene_type:complete